MKGIIINMVIIPQGVTNKIFTLSGNPTNDYRCPKELEKESQYDTFVSIIIVAIFVAAKVLRKVKECLYTEDWVKKMWCTNTMG